MSNIFRVNAPAAPAQSHMHIDRKRMRELQELRIALGHRLDDCEEEQQTQTQAWSGMTMKGRQAQNLCRCKQDKDISSLTTANDNAFLTVVKRYGYFQHVRVLCAADRRQGT